MNSEAISAIVSKHPALKASKAKLEAMEPGAYVVHRSWGFGQIKDYDEADQKLVIDFKDKKAHRMDPVFCVGSMDVLSPKHILARKETEPAKVKQLVEDDPVHAGYRHPFRLPEPGRQRHRARNRPHPGRRRGEVQALVLERQKAADQDPRVGVPAKKTEAYVVREEPVSAETEIMEEFSNTRSARRRISLAEDLLAASIKEESKQSLGTVLNGIIDAVRDSNQLDASERLYGAFVRDELARILGHEVGGSSPLQADLIKEVRGCPPLPRRFRSISSPSSWTS